MLSKGNNKTKRLATDWEKIFVNDVTNKGLVSKIYKWLMTLNIIKTNNPIKKWEDDLNRYFFRKDIQPSKRHVNLIGGNVNWYRHYGEQYEGSFKKTKIELP